MWSFSINSFSLYLKKIYISKEKEGGGGERLNYASRFSTIIPDIYRYGSEMPNSNRSFLFHSIPMSHE